jgi:hypothetical protein
MSIKNYYVGLEAKDVLSRLYAAQKRATTAYNLLRKAEVDCVGAPIDISELLSRDFRGDINEKKYGMYSSKSSFYLVADGLCDESLFMVRLCPVDLLAVIQAVEEKVLRFEADCRMAIEVMGQLSASRMREQEIALKTLLDPEMSIEKAPLTHISKGGVSTRKRTRKSGK